MDYSDLLTRIHDIERVLRELRSAALEENALRVEGMAREIEARAGEIVAAMQTEGITA